MIYFFSKNSLFTCCVYYAVYIEVGAREKKEEILQLVKVVIL